MAAAIDPPTAVAPPGSRRVPARVWDEVAAARRVREAAEEEARACLAAACAEAERVRREAEAAGREEGLARATELLARAAAARDRLLAGAEEELVEVALELARRIAVRAAALDGEVVVEMAARALAEARGREAVRLHAHPDDLAALRDALPRLQAGLGGALALAPDPALERGEARVETEAGTVEARLAPQLEALGRALRGEEEGGW